MSVGKEGQHERVLDPVERLSEVLFGLIMVLSFTCSISAASAEREEVREVLVGAIGCNIAWGVVDAVMYLLTLLIERGRSLRIARSVRASPDPGRGRQMIADALPEPLDELFEGGALESARAKLVALPALDEKLRLSWRDLRGALSVFLLVFLSTLPVVVPFLFVSFLSTLPVVVPFLYVSPLQRAIRVSNCVAIAMLYVTGHMLGRYAGLGPKRTGFVMVAIGIVLVGITIALGG